MPYTARHHRKSYAGFWVTKRSGGVVCRDADVPSLNLTLQSPSATDLCLCVFRRGNKDPVFGVIGIQSGSDAILTTGNLARIDFVESIQGNGIAK